MFAETSIDHLNNQLSGNMIAVRSKLDLGYRPEVMARGLYSLTDDRSGFLYPHFHDVIRFAYSDLLGPSFHEDTPKFRRCCNNGSTVKNAFVRKLAVFSPEEDGEKQPYMLRLWLWIHEQPEYSELSTQELIALAKAKSSVRTTGLFRTIETVRIPHTEPSVIQNEAQQTPGVRFEYERLFGHYPQVARLLNLYDDKPETIPDKEMMIERIGRALSISDISYLGSIPTDALEVCESLREGLEVRLKQLRFSVLVAGLPPAAKIGRPRKNPITP